MTTKKPPFAFLRTGLALLAYLAMTVVIGYVFAVGIITITIQWLQR